MVVQPVLAVGEIAVHRLPLLVERLASLVAVPTG